MSRKFKITEIETLADKTDAEIQDYIDRRISPDVEMIFVNGKVWEGKGRKSKQITGVDSEI